MEADDEQGEGASDGEWSRELLSARDVREQSLKAAGRRLRESRMTENFTYGLKRQGMETRIRRG
jgi:hypothetical protein